MPIRDIGGNLKEVLGEMGRERANARNAKGQSQARKKATREPKMPLPKPDSTTQRLIDQAKARSAAKANNNIAPDPQPSITGEFTYNMPIGGGGGIGNIDKEIDKIYDQKTPDFLGDAKKDAKRIYAPIFADLDKQGKQAKGSSKKDIIQLKDMYGRLSNSIGADGRAISRNTNAAVADTRENTADTVQDIGQNFSSANNEVADLMRSLGLEAAAGDALPKGAEHQAFLQGLVQSEGAGAVNLARQLGQNSQNFNTAQKNIAGFEGAQNVAARQKNLSDVLAQLATTRASVGSQRAGQASSLAQQLRGDYTNSLNSRANALVTSYGQQQQMDIARMQAQAQIETARINSAAQQAAAERRAAGAGQPSLKQQYDMTSPGEKIFATAAQLFGNDSKQASHAVNLANHVAASNASKLDANGRPTGDNRFPTAARFAEAVTHANSQQPPEKRLAPDKLLALAYAMFPNL